MELNLVVTWREAVVLLALVALVYLAGVLLGMIRGRSSHDKPSNPGADFSRMRTEIETLRLRVDSIEQRFQNVEESDRPSNDPLYDSAQRLIKQGLSAHEVAGRLGLSRAEVDLIAVLHRENGVCGGDTL